MGQKLASQWQNIQESSNKHNGISLKYFEGTRILAY